MTDRERERLREERAALDRDTRRRAAREESARRRAAEDVAGDERPMQRSARERVEDRVSGRAERGFFTGRGRKKRPEDAGGLFRGRDHDRDRDRKRSRVRDEDDERPRPRTGAKRTIIGAIRLLPRYLRLLIGLIGDRRVSRWDRFFVLAAAAYIISPLDFIPDVIPFLGEVDDLFILMLALQRLVNNAGHRVLLDHWKGDPAQLSSVNLARVVSAAGFFLPTRLKHRLRKMVS